MRGQRIDNAFSNYSRFIPPTKFELEALEERSKYNFSAIDTNKKLLKRVANSPGFVQQMPRGENFLKPELVKVEEVNRQLKAQRKQRLQQMYNELGMNDEAGSQKQAQTITFQYESHKNAKDLRTMVRTLIDCVDGNAREIKLSHMDNPHNMSFKKQKTGVAAAK